MAKKTNRAIVSTSAMYIPLPNEFLNMLDEPWILVKQDELPVELSLLDILIITVRRMPAKDHGESERALELIQTFKAALSNDDAEYVEVRKADYEWMQGQFKAHAHKFWAAPDSAFLRKWLDDNTTDQMPEGAAVEQSPNGVVDVPEGEPAVA